MLRDTNEDLRDQKNVGQWISRFLVLLLVAGEDRNMLCALHARIVNRADDASLKRILQESFQKRLKDVNVILQRPEMETSTDKAVLSNNREAAGSSVAPQVIFEQPAERIESMEGLEPTRHEDIADFLADDRLPRLCRCLSSLADEMRNRAYLGLQGVMTQIQVDACAKIDWSSANALRSCLATWKMARCSS